VKIGLNQPNYIPWLGYFELLDTVEHFIFLDNAQYSRGSFISRNKLADHSGRVSWLSLSLKKSSHHDSINNKIIIQDGLEDHLNKVKNYYRKSPHFTKVFEVYRDTLQTSHVYLSELNIQLLLRLSELIGIHFDYSRATDSPKCSNLQSIEKIFCLIDQYDYKAYYNFANGVDIGLYDSKDFIKKKKLLYKQEYKHPTYKRPLFQPYMSILDLLFYELPNALEIIRSGSKWVLMNEEMA